MDETERDRYKAQVAAELDSEAYDCVTEAHVLDDGRLVAYLNPEMESPYVALQAVLNPSVDIADRGNGIVELDIDERWASHHLDDHS